ncbi:MAG: ROK family protein [Pirellulales bacterium]|nr:ROK family protein [Pirellulales bacterium]
MSDTPRFHPVGEAQRPFYVGIDLGGTNIKVGVVDDLGRALSYLSIPTEVAKGAEDAAARMGAAVAQVVQSAGLTQADIARVGLGSPGTMDIPRGMLLKPVNLQGWNDFPLRDRVKHHCSLPVTFENDANAAAYGEFWVGSGRDLHSLALFTLGTGIGSGIIIDDLPIDGENSHGGECGHTIIDFSPNARLCGCGKRGHLEAYASATAVVQRTQEALEAGRASSLGEKLTQHRRLTAKLIAHEAEAGDPLCLEIVEETARYLAVGVVNLLHTIDPHGVLLGGAMTFGGHETSVGRRFLAEIRAEVRRRAFPLLAERTVIDYAALGSDAGFIGAAGLARLEHLKHK